MENDSGYFSFSSYHNTDPLKFKILIQVHVVRMNISVISLLCVKIRQNGRPHLLFAFISFGMLFLDENTSVRQNFI